MRKGKSVEEVVAEMLPPRSKVTLSLVLLVPTIAACGVGTILKAPVEERCQSAGLKGCPQLTDGVIAYVEGDSSRGLALVGQAAAENTPEDIRIFADMLSTLESVPGVKEYAGPALEIAKVLREQASTEETEARKSARAAPSPASPAAQPFIVSPAEEVERRAGQVRPFFEEGRRQCADLEWSACAPTKLAPLVLTDLSVSPACGASVIIFATSDMNPPQASRARWALFGSITGGNWPIEPGDVLVVALFGKDLADARSHDACTVSWAGYVPKKSKSKIDDL